MAPRYERVNGSDTDDNEDNEHTLLPSPTDNAPNPTSASRSQPTPNSPPPSFHSRASSPATSPRHHPVNSALADAFGSDDDASDHESDDDVRQRLVRRSTAEHAGAQGYQSTSHGATSGGAQSAQASGTLAAAGSSSSQMPSAATTRTAPQRVFGGGMQSDGVFSNLSARPEVGGQVEKEELPPTYEQAAADQAPPYWETTILAPGLGGPDEVYLDGMPIGSLFSFLWNAVISMSFQLVGFLLTYLLHSTHAAKNGSRAGLGVTLIQYGFYLRGSPADGPPGSTDNNGYSAPFDPNSHDFDPNNLDTSGGGSFASITASEWMAYVMMVLGWFILIRAVSDYLRARRHEMLVLGSPGRGFGVVGVFADGETPDRVV